MMRYTVDTSIFADFIFEFDENRTNSAEKVLSEIKGRILNPKVFKVEMACILSRRFHSEIAEKIISEILEDVALIDNPDELAYENAIKTGCRAIDAYFIATAKLTDSVLITNDRTMAENARKAGIEAYYLLEEFEKVKKRLQ